jgi:nucleoid DNA-binding protein
MKMAKTVLIRIWYEEEDFKDMDAEKYIEALLEKIEEQSHKNGYPITITIAE